MQLPQRRKNPDVAVDDQTQEKQNGNAPEPISSQRPRRLSCLRFVERSAERPLKIRHFVGQRLQAVDLVANLEPVPSRGSLMSASKLVRESCSSLASSVAISTLFPWASDWVIGSTSALGLHVRETVQETVRLLFRLVKDFAELLVPLDVRDPASVVVDGIEQRRFQIVSDPARAGFCGHSRNA